MNRYQIIVEQFRKGFWGYKSRVVLNVSGDDPEPLLAEASKYTADCYSVIFRDFTDQFPEPAPAMVPEAVRAADKLDPELEQEWAEQMGWVNDANARGGHGQDIPF
jgi:hypothetical protein